MEEAQCLSDSFVTWERAKQRWPLGFNTSLRAGPLPSLHLIDCLKFMVMQPAPPGSWRLIAHISVIGRCCKSGVPYAPPGKLVVTPLLTLHCPELYSTQTSSLCGTCLWKVIPLMFPPGEVFLGCFNFCSSSYFVEETGDLGSHTELYSNCYSLSADLYYSLFDALNSK